MYPLFEAIKVVDGEFQNLEWHQQRVDSSRQELYGTRQRLLLADHLQVPPHYRSGIVKCRVSYGIRFGPVVFSEYKRKSVESLQQVECEPFDYQVKYEDRSKLESLYGLRGDCDEILISHDQIIVDTSYSNVVLFDGTRWYTPASPLLRGTHRARLLAENAVTPMKISIDDLSGFQKLVLINSMLEFDSDNFISIENIKLWTEEQILFR